MKNRSMVLLMMMCLVAMFFSTDNMSEFIQFFIGFIICVGFLSVL